MKIVIDIPQKTIEHIRSDYGHGYRGFYDEDRVIILDAIYSSTTPKNKVSEFIPCKDCRRYEIIKTRMGESDSFCERFGCSGLDENDYCSRAERKTDRDCNHCTHHTEQGCTKWDCEFERRTE